MWLYVCVCVYIYNYMFLSYVCRYDITCMCTSSTWLDIMSYAELHMIDMELSWEMSYYDARSLAHTSHISFGVLQIHLEMCRWVTPTKTVFLRFRTCEKIAEKSWCNELSEVKMKSVLKINGHSLTSLVVEPTQLKNMIVKLEIFPNFRGKNETCLSCHHLQAAFGTILITSTTFFFRPKTTSFSKIDSMRCSSCRFSDPFSMKSETLSAVQWSTFFKVCFLFSSFEACWRENKFYHCSVYPTLVAISSSYHHLIT